jgi:hypothetical protein
MSSSQLTVPSCSGTPASKSGRVVIVGTPVKISFWVRTSNCRPMRVRPIGACGNSAAGRRCSLGLRAGEWSRALKSLLNNRS